MDEYRLKAAFLFHFAELVDWPVEAFDGDRKPLVLCTLGGNPFEGGLEAVVNGKLLGARQIRVRHLKQAQEIPGCHVLFIGSSEQARVPMILAKLKDAPILTVGEPEEFVKDGGMIGLRLEGNRVRFDINLEAARRAGLKISSRLLVLARIVIGGHS